MGPIPPKSPGPGLAPRNRRYLRSRAGQVKGGVAGERSERPLAVTEHDATIEPWRWKPRICPIRREPQSRIFGQVELHIIKDARRVELRVDPFRVFYDIAGDDVIVRAVRLKPHGKQTKEIL